MMPSIGNRDAKATSREFSDIQMKKEAPPKQQGNGQIDFDNMTAKEKERYFHNLTGYKEKKSLFKNGKKHNIMNKDSFMQLFIAQLKNQDPSKPMDQNKLTAELAQFSQLEQMTNMNKKFDKLTKGSSLESKFFGASFLGKEVISKGNTVTIEDNKNGTDVHYALDSDAKRVSIQLLDDKQNILKQYWKEGVSQGNHQLHWDGDQEDGAPSPSGTYHVRVVAWDKGNEMIPANVMNKGVVTAVHMEGEEPVLVVNGKQVALRDIESFKMVKQVKQVQAQQKQEQKMMNHPMHNTQDELKLRQAAAMRAAQKGQTQRPQSTQSQNTQSMSGMRGNYNEK